MITSFLQFIVLSLLWMAPFCLFGEGDNGIHLWYGKEQTFGKPGSVQRYINLLGNLDRETDFTSLDYSLNDGPFQLLSIGPDERRLQRNGDFNVEIPIRHLLAGKNSVVIEAVDKDGNVHSETLTVYWKPEFRMPDHVIRWSEISDLFEVAQPIDGLWRIEGDFAVSDPDADGYDRVLGFGDMSWRDYEVVFPFEIRGIDTGSYESETSVGPAILYIMRWRGHTDSPVECVQPHCGWEPYGGTVSYAWLKDEVGGWTLSTKMVGESVKVPKFTFQTGEKYWFRGRDETTGAGNFFSFKVWQGGPDNEPDEWTAKYLAGPLNLESGSLALVAHHVDLAIGTMEFTPLANLRYKLVDILNSYTDMIVQLPYLAIWVIGIFWALAYKKRDPRRGKMILLAFVILLVTGIAGSILLETLPDYLQHQGWMTRRLTYVYVLINGIPIGGHVLAWAILFKTLFPPKDTI